MTLADVYLAITISDALFSDKGRLIYDTKVRDKDLPNLSRYTTLIYEMIGHIPHKEENQEQKIVELDMHEEEKKKQ
jgi:hypothetical protein